MHTAFERTRAPALVELYRESGHRCFGCGSVVLVYSVDEPDSAYMERNASAMRRYATQYPAGLGCMVLVPEAAKPPSEEARSAIRAGYVAMKSFMRAGVLVFEGQGFAASAKRSVVTLLNLAAPLPFPVKVASTPLEAAQKLAGLLGEALLPPIEPQQLAAAMEEIRSVGIAAT